MKYPIQIIKHNFIWTAFGLLLFSFAMGLSGCASDSKTPETDEPDTGTATEADSDAPLRDNTPNVLVPEASGTAVYGNDLVSIDGSHLDAGYVMMQYNGTNEKVKLQIQTPEETTYTYLVSSRGTYDVYPLSGGNGAYTLTLLESADVTQDLYSIAFTQNLDVQIGDEFTPFLYPNVYSNFTSDSACVKKGSDLAADCHNDLEVITSIYDYVTDNISYDDDKAANVSYGYIPDPDETMANGTGICFDYASLMTAMLRSQQIPTRLDVGYAGELYHAWISCYVKEIGWVNDIIHFDGKNWSLMDPTYAANHSSSSVKKYIGDGSNYVVKYTY